jgi:hypothetical protein
MTLYKKETRKERRMRRLEEAEGGELNSIFHHSTYYHRFFENYSEAMVPKKNGKGNRIIRMYTGYYYRRACSDLNWVLTKFAYIVLYLIGASAYICAFGSPLAGNFNECAALPGLLSAVAMLLLLANIISCTFENRTMTIYGYRTSFKRLVLFCYIAGGLLFATLMVILLSIMLNPKDISEKELFSLFFCLAAAVSVAIIGHIERKAKYERLPSDNKPISNGVIIQ